jgi:hypothetical protein
MDHDNMLRVNLESNAVLVRDVEEIDRLLKKNKEAKVKQRMPKFKSELNSLVKSRKVVELSDTLS